MARMPFGVIEARPVSFALHFWTCSLVFSFAENPEGYQRGVGDMEHILNAAQQG